MHRKAEISALFVAHSRLEIIILLIKFLFPTLRPVTLVQIAYILLPVVEYLLLLLLPKTYNPQEIIRTKSNSPVGLSWRKAEVHSLQSLEICKNEILLVAWQPFWYWNTTCVVNSHFSCCLRQKINLMDGGLKSVLFNKSGFWKSRRKISFSPFLVLQRLRKVKLFHPGESKQAELMMAMGKSPARHPAHDSSFWRTSMRATAGLYQAERDSPMFLSCSLFSRTKGSFLFKDGKRRETFDDGRDFFSPEKNKDLPPVFFLSQR